MADWKFTIIFFNNLSDIKQAYTTITLINLHCSVNIILFFHFTSKRISDINEQIIFFDIDVKNNKFFPARLYDSFTCLHGIINQISKKNTQIHVSDI